MSVGSSPSSNASSGDLYFILFECFDNAAFNATISSFTIATIILIFPLCVYIIYLGLQRRSGVTTSHSDVFTYHMVATEMLSVVGSVLMCFGTLIKLPEMIVTGVFLLSINMSGQTYFHLLTCADRYLAVVHPVTYRNLKNDKGVRIRNATIGCSWSLSFAGTGLLFVTDTMLSEMLTFVILVLNLAAISFCSGSVLCVLIRPGPGEGGGAKLRTDQSKLRAFHTITAILGVLLFRLGGTLLFIAVNSTVRLERSLECCFQMAALWFGLPSSLVLPLLFLQRAGKLACWKSDSSRQTSH
ncbi:uncharacterized protein V6R79_020347 [Siganus canaliculatus]